MIHSTTLLRATGGLRIQRLRERAGLSRATLAAISSVGLNFIGALENDRLCLLVADQEIQHALARADGRGLSCLMQRTLTRWSENLHRLADALAETFENLFSADDLAALSDQLWLKIQRGREQRSASDQPSTTVLPDKPWHDWGWFRNVALLDDLPDDRSDDPAENCLLEPAIRELLTQLGPRERLVLTLHYGLDGPGLTLAEIGQQLGLTRNEVRRFEYRALRRLKRPKYRDRLLDWLE